VALETYQLRDPNSEQRAIIESTNHSLIIQANAGATKTTTLAFKAKSMLSRSPAGMSILFLVFTRAAKEAAVEKLKWVGCSKEQMSKISVLTFDEFSHKVLRSVEDKIFPFRRVLLKPTPENVAPYVKNAMAELSIQGEKGFIERFLKLNRRIKGCMDVDRLKWNDDFNPRTFAENHNIALDLLRLHLRYEKLRYDRERDGFDRPVFRSEFDATYDLACLLADPEKRTPIQEISGWPHHLSAVLVDEMHDTNLAMFTIITSLLTSTSAHFCGVGDPDQVVFSHYGAQATYMSGLNDFAGRSIVSLPLTVSFRFGADVGRIAARIANGKTYDCLKGLNTTVILAPYVNETNANQLLLSQIKTWRLQSNNDVSGVVILLRHPWQSVAIESLLIDEDIHYEIRGFNSFLNQPEVLLIRVLHAVATGNERLLGDSALRALMVESLAFFFGVELPREESESESYDERLAIAIDHAVKDGYMRLFFENVLLKKCSPDILRRVRNAMVILSKEMFGKDEFQRIVENLEIEQWVEEVFIETQRKIDALRYFEALKNAVQKHKSMADYFSLLCDYEDRKESRSRNLNTQYSLKAALKKRTLTIALVSEVKGFEFDNVLIPYLQDGIFPFDIYDSLQEEKNLLYVAVTRAKKNLCLLVHKEKPSRFLTTG
jgi:DNA helicase II / ATP-dependent DNA helicase PcrA